MNLLNETRSLLETANIPKSEICANAKVHPRWLDYLITEQSRDFRIFAVQRVYDFLTSQVNNDSLVIENKTIEQDQE